MFVQCVLKVFLELTPWRSISKSTPVLKHSLATSVITKLTNWPIYSSIIKSTPGKSCTCVTCVMNPSLKGLLWKPTWQCTEAKNLIAVLNATLPVLIAPICASTWKPMEEFIRYFDFLSTFSNKLSTSLPPSFLFGCWSKLLFYAIWNWRGGIVTLYLSPGCWLEASAGKDDNP